MRQGTDVAWREHYAQRLLSADEIVARVKPGSRIYIVIGHESAVLMAGLLARADQLEDVELRKLGGFWEDYGVYTPEWTKKLRVNVSFATAPSRQAVNDGIVDFTPVGFGDVNRDIEQGRAGSRRYDQCWFTVTPPNAEGYCCVGASLWDLRTGMRNSTTKVAGINRYLPKTFGDTWLHVSEIDFFFEHHDPIPERAHRAPQPGAQAIADHVSGLVHSGDTIHIGAGTTTFSLALLGAFDDKEDLGYFAETTPPGMIDLVKRGVITSKYATAHPRKFVTTGVTLTGPADAEYIDENAFFEFRDYDYLLDPSVIKRNDRFVAIHNALSVDLFGQVAVSSLGPKIHAGTGGQLAFHTGAFLSKGGRAVTVLPALTTDGRQSRIVPQHPPGQIVTIPFDLADTVVTEYGVADLLGKSLRQRADALIAVAHPDVRPELRAAIRRYGG